MGEKHFWGENGEYGPFTAQEDGWPHAGEVVRSYRRALKIRAEDLATQYSVATNTSITSRWILKMEQQNKVPTDITRRRTLAQLLQIPPILLGLAPLEQVMLKPLSGQSVEKSTQHAAPTFGYYEQENRLLWQLHETSSAHTSISHVDATIARLKGLASKAQGRLKEQILLLLSSYYELCSDITRDQRKFTASYAYADACVSVATTVGNPALLATAHYTRGYTNLVWGLFGEVNSTGVCRPTQEKIVAAIHDFEHVLPHAQNSLKGPLLLELSRAYGSLKRSATDTTIALKLIDQAEHWIGSEAQEGVYPSTSIQSFNKGRYYLGKAVALIACGHSGKAIDALEMLENLRGTRGIARNHLRRHTWIDIQYTHACISMKEYYEATRHAINALLLCEDIHAICNITILNDLYSRLPQTFAKGNSEVAALGVLLGSSKHSNKEEQMR